MITNEIEIFSHSKERSLTCVPFKTASFLCFFFCSFFSFVRFSLVLFFFFFQSGHVIVIFFLFCNVVFYYQCLLSNLRTPSPCSGAIPLTVSKMSLHYLLTLCCRSRQSGRLKTVHVFFILLSFFF